MEKATIICRPPKNKATHIAFFPYHSPATTIIR